MITSRQGGPRLRGDRQPARAERLPVVHRGPRRLPELGQPADPGAELRLLHVPLDLLPDRDRRRGLLVPVRQPLTRGGRRAAVCERPTRPCRTEVRDDTGALATPGTILLRVKKPDGTPLPDYTTPTADSLGKYHQDIPAADLTVVGHYAYAWITTGTAAGCRDRGVRRHRPVRAANCCPCRTRRRTWGRPAPCRTTRSGRSRRSPPKSSSRSSGRAPRRRSPTRSTHRPAVRCWCCRGGRSSRSRRSRRCTAATPTWVTADLQVDPRNGIVRSAESGHVLRRAVHRRLLSRADGHPGPVRARREGDAAAPVDDAAGRRRRTRRCRTSSAIGVRPGRFGGAGSPFGLGAGSRSRTGSGSCWQPSRPSASA